MFKSKVAIGLRVLQRLRDTEGVSVLADVAHEIDVSCSYAEQVFSVLGKAGLVEGKRGPGGGYVLAPMQRVAGWVFDFVSLREFTAMFYPDEDIGFLNSDFAERTLDEVLS